MRERAAGDEPSYRRIAASLRVQILDGTYPPGARLPSERQLSTTFGVSRPTVRDAVDALRAEGLVISRHGLGVFVRPHRRLRPWPRGASPAQAVSADNEDETHSQGHAYREPANHRTAELLGVRAGDEVLVRHELVSSSDRPLHLITSRAPVTTRTSPNDPSQGGVGSLERPEDFGELLRRVEERVSARMPGEDEARQLALPDGTPVLEVQRTEFGSLGPVETTTLVIASDVYELHYKLRG